MLPERDGGLAGRTVLTEAAEVREDLEDRRLDLEPDFSVLLVALKPLLFP